jgi:hypothetical protein
MVFLSHRSMIGGNWSTLFPLKVRARSSVSSSSSNSRRNRRVIKERFLRRAPPPPQQRRPDWDVSTAALSISDLVLLLCFYPPHLQPSSTLFTDTHLHANCVVAGDCSSLFVELLEIYITIALLEEALQQI